MNSSSAETIKIGSGLRGIHLVVFSLLVLMMFGGITWVRDGKRVKSFIESIDFLKIKTLEIKADWPLESSQIESWVGALKNQNILLLDAKEVAQSLQSRPWIETVAVKKGYPNRIQITLITKKPQALIVHKGQTWFVDPQGGLIERASPQLLRGLDLPFLSVDSSHSDWDVSRVLEQHQKIQTLAKGKLEVAQIVLGKFPYLKTYLSQPKIEVLWSFENWEDQFENLLKLINDPPGQIGQLRRINLVFPKKAIVSSSISH